MDTGGNQPVFPDEGKVHQFDARVDILRSITGFPVRALFGDDGDVAADENTRFFPRQRDQARRGEDAGFSCRQQGMQGGVETELGRRRGPEAEMTVVVPAGFRIRAVLSGASAAAVLREGIPGPVDAQLPFVGAVDGEDGRLQRDLAARHVESSNQGAKPVSFGGSPRIQEGVADTARGEMAL